MGRLRISLLILNVVLGIIYKLLCVCLIKIVILNGLATVSVVGYFALDVSNQLLGNLIECWINIWITNACVRAAFFLTQFLDGVV